MKVIIFDNDKNIIEVLHKIVDPQIYDLDEITWQNGGMADIRHNYIIVEDDVEFENVTDTEILEQYKQQVIYTLARKIEENRVEHMVKGVLQQVEADFEEDKIAINNFINKEEVNLRYFEARDRIY